MIGYIKREKMLSVIQDQIDFNWKMQKRFGELAETLNDAASKNRHLDMQEEYINRWNECVRLYNILKQTK